MGFEPKLNAGWMVTPLIECTKDKVISYGVVQPGKHEPQGIPIVRVNNITSNDFSLDNVLFIAREIEGKFSRTRLSGGEVLLTLVGSTGLSMVVPKELAGWNVPRAIAVMRIKDEIGAEWVNICLQTKEVAEYLDSRANTTVQKTLNLKDVREIPIILPPKHLKSAIESIALTISKKINGNSQINQTLEQMAQALFKSWFVDFEPVKAKMAVLEVGGSQEEATLAAMTAISGKNADALVVFEREHPEQYAELKATAELFPSAMQDSELGEIPVDWHVGDLSTLALLNANSWTKKNAPENVSYVDLANTKWGVINSTEKYQFSDAPSRARRILKPYDTIVGTVRPGNGSYSYISKSGLTGSTGFAVLTPKYRIFSEYVYLCVTSNENIERLAHLADGGAYPAVNADVVLSTMCVLPAEQKMLEDMLKTFSSKIEVFFSYRTSNLEQNEMLSELRDTLLPKLLSGEITLPEAEQAVSEAENV